MPAEAQSSLTACVKLINPFATRSGPRCYSAGHEALSPSVTEGCSCSRAARLQARFFCCCSLSAAGRSSPEQGSRTQGAPGQTSGRASKIPKHHSALSGLLAVSLSRGAQCRVQQGDEIILFLLLKQPSLHLGMQRLQLLSGKQHLSHSWQLPTCNKRGKKQKKETKKIKKKGPSRNLKP